jgi:hypothetical protein
LKKKDYGLNELEIVAYPDPSIISTGRHVGSPVLPIKMGKGIKLTNKQLWDYITDQHPHIDMCLFTSDEDPMIYSKEIWSFVKYCNSFYRGKSYRERWWGIVTPGTVFDSKVLWEIDDILIDVLPPSSGSETPPEFISWCYEDNNIKDKVQFRISLASNAPDITFARTQIPLLGTFRSCITLQPIYWNKKQLNTEFEKANTLQNTSVFEYDVTQPIGWKSYAHFVSEFLGLIRYPYVRILPDLVRILGIKKIHG